MVGPGGLIYKQGEQANQGRGLPPRNHSCAIKQVDSHIEICAAAEVRRRRALLRLKDLDAAATDLNEFGSASRE